MRNCSCWLLPVLSIQMFLGCDFAFGGHFQHEDKESPVRVSGSIHPTPVNRGDEVTLRIQLKVSPGWFVRVGAKADAKRVASPASLSFAPKGLTAVDKDFGIAGAFVWAEQRTAMNYRGTVTFERRYRVQDAGDFSGVAKIEYQAFRAGELDKKRSVSLRFGDGKTLVNRTANEVSLSLSPAKLTRQRIKFRASDLLVGGTSPTEESLDFVCLLENGEKTLKLYLPKRELYEMKNTATGQSRFQNTATYLSIDYDGNGEISSGESVPLNRPFRAWDSMFQVAEINTSIKKMRLKRVDSPLSGCVPNQACPPFQFQAVNGKGEVSSKSILGKPTILIIWAST